MLDLRGYLDQLSYFWKVRSTLKGLIGLFAVVNLFLFTVMPLVYFILDKIEFIKTPDEFKNFVLLSLLGWGVLNLLSILLWVSWRRVYNFPIGKIGIIFAPHSDPECNDIIYKLYDQFKLDLSKKGLSDILTYKLMPKSNIIKNHEEATILLHKTEARLIIHGYIQKGKIKSEEIEGFKTISFTLRHRNLAKIEIKPVLSALANAIAYRAFVSREKNSFIEKQLVIDNLSEVALFFISMGLTLEGKLEESLKILSNLKKIIDEKLRNPKHSTQLNYFRSSVIKNLTVTLNALLINVYRSKLIDNITERTHDIYAKECMKYLNHLVEINKRTSDFYLQKAIIHFHFGEIRESFQCVKKAKKLAPLNSPGVHFSLAFLNLWDKQYLTSLKEYRRAERCAIEGIDFIMDILLFLQSVLNNNSNRIEIIYALAFINEKYFDKSKAIDDYKKFIEVSEGNNKLNPLRAYAISRLKLIQ